MNQNVEKEWCGVTRSLFPSAAKTFLNVSHYRKFWYNHRDQSNVK